MAGRAILLRFAGDTTSLERSFNKAGVASGQLESKTSNLKSALTGLATGAAAFAAVNFFKGSIDAASNLNESLSKTKVVFGEMSPAVEKFAQTASKNLGISKQAALEASGTFGNLFSALGLAKKPATDMSLKLVKLASDLASFNNVNPEDALESLRSGLLGEAEPLRKFGVSLSEARIQAEALAIGLVRPVKSAAAIDLATHQYEETQKAANKAIRQFGEDSLKAQPAVLAMEQAHKKLEAALAGQKVELTAAQKAQAAFSIIMKDTTTAQGDFSRTSDGLANRQRILKAQFADMQAKLGTQLLPVMNAVTSATIKIIEAFTNLSPEVQIAIGVVGGLVLTVFAITKAVQAWTAVQAAFNVVLAANPIVLVTLAIAALVAGVIYAYTHFEGFRNAVNAVGRALAAAFEWVKNNWPNLLLILTGPFRAASVVWRTFGDEIRGAVGAAFDWIRDRIRELIGVMDRLLGPLDETVGKLAGVLGKVTGVGGLIKHLPGFAAGGVVPGAIGAPQLAVVHGGERITPVGGGGGQVINLTVNATGDAQEIAAVVRRELVKLGQRNGSTGL